MVVGFVSGVGTNCNAESGSRDRAVIEGVCRGVLPECPFVWRCTSVDDGRWEEFGETLAGISGLPSDTGARIAALGI